MGLALRKRWILALLILLASVVGLVALPSWNCHGDHAGVTHCHPFFAFAHGH
jgi:hypothetical protein